MRLPRLAVLAALWAPACMPRYKYENPTLPEPVTSPEEQCYRDRRLALGTGEGSWTKQYGGTAGFVQYTVTEHWRSSGIAFRAGPSLQPARQIIAALPDPELQAAYAHQLDRTRTAHATYPLWRNVSLGIAFAGLGMAIGGLALVLGDPESDVALPLALGGAGVATVALIPALGAAFTYDKAVEHDIDNELFVRTEWAGRMARAAASYNERIAAECRFERADLPMTPRAQQMLGVR